MIILLFAYEGEFKRDARHGCITAQHCKANRYQINPEQNQRNACQIRHTAFCNAVTAFKGGQQLADAQPLMQTIILGLNNKDYFFFRYKCLRPFTRLLSFIL